VHVIQVLTFICCCTSYITLEKSSLKTNIPMLSQKDEQQSKKIAWNQASQMNCGMLTWSLLIWSVWFGQFGLVWSGRFDLFGRFGLVDLVWSVWFGLVWSVYIFLTLYVIRFPASWKGTRPSPCHESASTSTHVDDPQKSRSRTEVNVSIFKKKKFPPPKSKKN
jgi:hypothetical protein